MGDLHADPDPGGKKIENAEQKYQHFKATFGLAPDPDPHLDPAHRFKD